MKEYNQTIPVGKVRLTKEDLRQLVIMTGNQSQDPGAASSLVISTRLPELLISEETFDDFLRHTDLPPCLDNLSIRWAHEPPGGERIPDRLSLQLGSTTSQLQVSGKDQTWVLGKCEQLIRFLRSKQALPAVPGKNTRILLANPSPFWKVNKTGITLLLALLSLAVTIVLGILQFFRK
jgi:hypothetical protein